MNYIPSLHFFKRLPKKFSFVVGIIVIFAILTGGVFFLVNYKNRTEGSQIFYASKEEKKDIYVRFSMEAYDSILVNFWEKMSDAELSQLYRMSLAKAKGVSVDTVVLPTNDRAGTASMLYQELSDLDSEKKKKLTIDTLIVVLYNLPPEGRSGLLSTKAEKAFRDTVSNIDPSKDLYNDVGTQKGASVEEVKKAFDEKKAVLATKNTPEAKKELEQASYAYKVLTKPDSKVFYDQSQIEPTVFSQILGGKTLYINISKISPTTLREFGLAVLEATTTPALDSIIFDFRGNIGGTLDFAKYFLGVFIGQNQLAFDLFSQDEYKAQRTMLPKLDELTRYKEVAFLTDSMTQSTAELLAATFKRLKIGSVIGTPTRGWGTIENTYPLKTTISDDESYSLLLVNSITLRDNGEPIEGRGIDPTIDTRSSNWENRLQEEFRSSSMISSLKKVLQGQPLR